MLQELHLSYSCETGKKFREYKTSSFALLVSWASSHQFIHRCILPKEEEILPPTQAILYLQSIYFGILIWYFPLLLTITFRNIWIKLNFWYRSLIIREGASFSSLKMLTERSYLLTIFCFLPWGKRNGMTVRKERNKLWNTSAITAVPCKSFHPLPSPGLSQHQWSQHLPSVVFPYCFPQHRKEKPHSAKSAN